MSSSYFYLEIFYFYSSFSNDLRVDSNNFYTVFILFCKNYKYYWLWASFNAIFSPLASLAPKLPFKLSNSAFNSVFLFSKFSTSFSNFLTLSWSTFLSCFSFSILSWFSFTVFKLPVSSMISLSFFDICYQYFSLSCCSFILLY